MSPSYKVIASAWPGFPVELKRLNCKSLPNREIFPYFFGKPFLQTWKSLTHLNPNGLAL